MNDIPKGGGKDVEDKPTTNDAAAIERQKALASQRRALQMVPDDQREALVLVSAGGLSYEEAAHICGCAVGTIKSRVTRGRKALLEALESKKVPARDSPAEQALNALLDDARRLASDR